MSSVEQRTTACAPDARAAAAAASPRALARRLIHHQPRRAHSGREKLAALIGCLDPTLTALREKTWVVGADELGEAISDVMITLDDGVVFRERGDMSVPYTDMALQESRLKDKFIALVEPVLGQQRCDELAERLLGIESEQDLHALTELSQLRKD